MQQSPSLEANRFVANKEIPRILWNPKEGSLPHSQVPATCPYPEPAESSPCHHGMARPQVTDGGTAFNMKGSCE
jgi:hypothetical protein